MPENAGSKLLGEPEKEKWNVRHRELSASHKLAGIFHGWIPDGYSTSGKPRILYVGKATSGSFNLDQAECKCFNGKGAFWNFARQIADAVGCAEEGIPCIAWSNISKISCDQIRAEPTLIADFEEIAASTLESEIAKTRPHIIIFVTQHFGEQVVRQIADGYEDTEWSKSENESNHPAEEDIWWKRRADGRAVLWMRHPMGANKAKLAFAAKKIALLVRP